MGMDADSDGHTSQSNSCFRDVMHKIHPIADKLFHSGCFA